MKKFREIRESQKTLVASVVEKTAAFIRSVPKDGLEAILLSGSAGRGDYLPGKAGAMVDLVVMRKPGSTVSPVEIFGPNENRVPSFHCVSRAGERYQIAFRDLVDLEGFKTLAEPAKAALLESRVLWEDEGLYSKALPSIEEFAAADLRAELEKGRIYVEYLLSDYRKERWKSREAYPQLHENLNAAIRAATRCLFYLDGKYAPAEDRMLYHSHNLDNLPPKYEKLVKKLLRQKPSSRRNYRKRERLFRKKFLPVLDSFEVVDFPLRGEWLAVRTPAKKIPTHGSDVLGQRYAYDFLRLGPEGGERPFEGSALRYFTLGVRVKDCFCYRAEIFSPVDGVVVTARDGMKEPKRIQFFLDLLRKVWFSLSLLVRVFTPPRGRIDLGLILGNYIVVDFGGKCALFCHIVPHTIRVREGQPVKRGDVLGLVGHTGNSGAPHLHFQLMDSADLFLAKGVLCRFRGFEIEDGEAWRRAANAVPPEDRRVRILD